MGVVRNLSGTSRGTGQGPGLYHLSFKPPLTDDVILGKLLDFLGLSFPNCKWRQNSTTSIGRLHAESKSILLDICLCYW